MQAPVIPNTAASAPTQIPTIFKMAPVDSARGENNQSLLCSLYKLARVDKHQRDKNKTNRNYSVTEWRMEKIVSPFKSGH